MRECRPHACLQRDARVTRACVHALRAGERVCVRVCVHACVRACVCARRCACVRLRDVINHACVCVRVRVRRMCVYARVCML